MAANRRWRPWVLFSALVVAMAAALVAVNTTSGAEPPPALEPVDEGDSPLLRWQRPADQPVFTTERGNNHDAVFFHDAGAEYPYHLIVSHETTATHLWRAKSFSWSSSGWELVSDDFQVGGDYELDDGVKVGDTYYLFESGVVWTFDGPLEDASGKWEKAGTFPTDTVDDIGVFVEDGWFHIFGEYGDFPHGPDGTSLAQLRSRTGLGEWEMVNEKAVDPNPDGGSGYGVGDASIVKADGLYFLFADIETSETPYQVAAWSSPSLDGRFTYRGVVAAPREGVDDWDNHRVQDAEVAFVSELGRFVMLVNMMDVDDAPPRRFDTLREGESRVIGTLVSDLAPSVDGEV